MLCILAHTDADTHTQYTLMQTDTSRQRRTARQARPRHCNRRKEKPRDSACVCVCVCLKRQCRWWEATGKLLKKLCRVAQPFVVQSRNASKIITTTRTVTTACCYQRIVTSLAQFVSGMKGVGVTACCCLVVSLCQIIRRRPMQTLMRMQTLWLVCWIVVHTLVVCNITNIGPAVFVVQAFTASFKLTKQSQKMYILSTRLLPHRTHKHPVPLFIFVRKKGQFPRQFNQRVTLCNFPKNVFK